MVTITAPSSNPTPIYNRSGVTVDIMAAGTSSSPTPIVRRAGTTVVMVLPSTTGSNGVVKLPSDAEIGDVVEVYPIETDTALATNVATPSTSVVINSFFTTPQTVGIYRLLTSSNWGATWSVTR